MSEERLIDQRYRVIRPLGSGLSGEVLAVEDAEGQKALKFLKRVQLNVSREDALANFKSEFAILAELNHPGISRILDFGLDSISHKYFFTTELINGKDFFATLNGKPIEVIEELAVQVLRALHYLHSRGIYHLDIKPQNVLVNAEGDKLTAKIIDFGLAGFSAPRKKVGTPAYMAPEIIMGGNLDGRTDLYSFGVVLYKCLTGTNPFVCKEVRDTLNRQRTFVPEPPSKINPNVPKYWDEIVLRLLEKLPSERYPLGSAVIRDINFLANKNYEIETLDTRLSYIPEKGNLVSRRKETDLFKNLFEVIFRQESNNPNRLLIVEGKTGTGKSRLLSEFKYISQLKDIPVVGWKGLAEEKPAPPFCLLIEDQDGASPDEVNRILQQFANERILIVWATQKAPVGWSQSEVITLKPFTEAEIIEYVSMVTGLKNPPEKLVGEIYKRTDGNPLFVTELLKTLLVNNLLLDSFGHWASSAFEDIAINFEKIKVPQTLAGLLKGDYERLGEKERKILEWMAVVNRPLSIEFLKDLSQILEPHAAILNLTREDLIERTNREQHYFFSKAMLREVVYESLDPKLKRAMHDKAADALEASGDREEFLTHRGLGGDDAKAIKSLEELGALRAKGEHFPLALAALEQAWERARKGAVSVQIEVIDKLSEYSIASREYPKAIEYLEYLKGILEEPARSERFLERRVEVYERLGNVYGKMAQFAKATSLFETALEWLKSVPQSLPLKLLIQNHLAAIHFQSGDLTRAEAIFRENLETWEKTLTPVEKKKVANNWLADVLILKQDYAGALERIEKDLVFFESIEKRNLVARYSYLKGDVYFRLFLQSSDEEKKRTKAEAVNAFENALRISKQIDAHDLMLRAYNGIGNLHFHENEYPEANRNYERALALARKLGDLQTAAIIAMNMANVFKKQNANRDAYAYLIYAINTWEGMEQKSAVSWLNLFRDYAEIAETYAILGDFAKAEEAIDRAEKILRENDHLKSQEFWIWYLRAGIYQKENRSGLFRDALKKAESLAKEGFERDVLKEFKESLNPEEPKALPSLGSLIFKQMKDDSKTASVSELETILQINKFINSEHDPDHLLKMVLNFALELSGAESGLVLLLNEEGALEVKASVNATVDAQLKNVSTSVARQAIESGEVVVSEDALKDSRFDSSESVVLNDLKSVICLPLKSKNKVVGVLYLDNRYRTDAFKGINVRALNAYCDQVGIALENARLIAGYRAMQEKLTQALQKTESELVDARQMLKNETSAFLTRYSYSQIISTSKPMREVFKVLDKITETNISVYLHGASGTGKELIARALHFNNPQRAEKRFVAINCGAIPANLIESELFGHKAGSFTGANRDKKGLFEEANGGTVFLDEIGELELNLQVRLLRVLQEGEIQRLGETTPIKIDARVVCASHKVLEEMVKAATFREDLYYRLCQIKIELPALAERREDIPALAEHFVEKFRQENKIKEKLKIAPSLLKVLLAYPWPGNVRELENTINVACALRNGNILEPSSLPPNYGIARVQTAASDTGSLKVKPAASVIPIDSLNFFDPSKTWEQYEAVIIAKCFKENGFKKAAAASMLGLSQATLYNKVRDLGLEAKDNPLYQDAFTYQTGKTVKEYLPQVFQAALKHADDHPYAAIRQLGVSQGYFYKIIKR